MEKGRSEVQMLGNEDQLLEKHPKHIGGRGLNTVLIPKQDRKDNNDSKFKCGHDKKV